MSPEAQGQVRREHNLDNETQEALQYGGLYRLVKLWEMEIDRLITMTDMMIADRLAKVDLGITWAICEADAVQELAFWNTLPEGVKLPQDWLDALEALRQVNRLRLARAWFEDRIRRIRLAARLHGASEHGWDVRGRYSEEMWQKSAKRVDSKSPLSRRAIEED